MGDKNEEFICIAREPHTQDEFNKLYKKTEINQSFREKLQAKNRCSKDGLWMFFANSIPILRTIRYYKISSNIVNDILSGITCGLFQIPHALAFALLANVGIENGMYTSVWPVILYAIFGTTVHASMGTSAVVCMYIASVIDRQVENFKSFDILNSTNASTLEYGHDLETFKANIGSSVTLITGLIMFLFGLLKAGFLSNLLSEAFIKAFTSGAAIHAIISQIPIVLAVNTKTYGGIFKIGYIIGDIFKNISYIHGVTLLISVITLAVLLLFKVFINVKLKSKLPIPMPVELFVIILGIVITASTKLGLEVHVVGPVSNTIPHPYVPDLSGCKYYILDCFILTLLVGANNTAVSRIFAKKHHIIVDYEQELRASGLCNFIGSFFHCIPSSFSISRSMIMSLLNARTIFCGLISGIFMLFILVISSFVFDYLPKAVLSTIVIVSMKPLLFQIVDARKFWRVDKYEFFVWSSTFITTVLLDLNYGFLLGFGFAVILVVVETQFVSGFRLSKMVEDKVIVEHKKYRNALETNGIKVYRFQSNLYFATAEIFKRKLYRQTVNPRKLLKYLKKQEKKLAKLKKMEQSENGTHDISKSFDSGINSTAISVTSDIPAISVDYQRSISKIAVDSVSRQDSMASTTTNLTNLTNESEEEDPDDGQQYITERKFEMMRKVHHIILDFSTVNYMDITGANMLIQISAEYSNADIKVFLANCSSDILKTLDQTGILETIPQNNIFIELYDAIAMAIQEQRMNIFTKIDLDNSSSENKF